MNAALTNAIVNGGSNAAREIHQGLIKAGAVEPSEKLTILLAQIIVKNIMVEIEIAEKAAHDAARDDAGKEPEP